MAGPLWTTSATQPTATLHQQVNRNLQLSGSTRIDAQGSSAQARRPGYLGTSMGGVVEPRSPSRSSGRTVGFASVLEPVQHLADVARASHGHIHGDGGIPHHHGDRQQPPEPVSAYHPTLLSRCGWVSTGFNSDPNTIAAPTST